MNILRLKKEVSPLFARHSAIEAAYQSQELWSKLRAGGLRNIDEHFSPEVAQAALEELVLHPVSVAATE